MFENNISIRNLHVEDLPEMYKAFKSAFHDYPIPFDLTEQDFRKKFVDKLNLNLNLSAGAFNHGLLQGFIFTSISNYRGLITAYNGGTGVVPLYRGNGLTTQLYDFLLPDFKKHNVSMCILEVLTENKPAIKVYKNIGFRVTRNYKCFKLNPATALSIKEHDKVRIVKVQSPNWEKYNRFLDYIPSYLDSPEMIDKNLSNEVVIEASINNTITGYAIFQPGTGRISHIAVDQGHRGKGIGSMLLGHIYEKSKKKELTLINVLDEADTVLRFLDRHGFNNEMDQYEMRLML